MSRLKKPSLLIFVLSLFVGGIITALCLAQMNWHVYTNRCLDQGSSAPVSNCAALEYGSPKRFLTSRVDVDAQNNVSAIVIINKPRLFFDWFIWSAVSFAILYFLTGFGKEPDGKAKN